MTRDAGKTWTNVTEHLPGLPEWGTIKMIEPSPFDAAVAYVVVDAHMIDDMHPYLYRTRDHGKTWTLLSTAPAPGHSAPRRAGRPQEEGHAVRGNRARRRLLGRRRQDLAIAPAQPAHRPGSRPGRQERRPRGGHPRALALDLRRPDADPVVRSPRSRTSRSTCLPPSRPPAGAIMERWAPWRRGDNPPAGAILHLWLKDKPKAQPKLEILDTDGKLVRSLGKPTEPEPTAVEKEGAAGKEPDRRGAGGQGEGRGGGRGRRPPRAGPGSRGCPRRRACTAWSGTWSYDPAKPIKDARIDSGNPETGPLALPGKYTVKLTVDGQTATAPLEILPDPRVKVPAAELPNRFAWRSPSAMISTSSPARSSGCGRFARSFRRATP